MEYCMLTFDYRYILREIFILLYNRYVLVFIASFHWYTIDIE